MDYPLGVILATLPLPIFAWFLYWMLKMQSDPSSSLRGPRQKLKDWNTRKKLVGYSIMAYWIFVVHVFTASILSQITATDLPFAGIDSLVMIWMLALGFIGLGWTIRESNPRRIA